MRQHFVDMWNYTLWANTRIMDALVGRCNGEAVRLVNHIIGAQDEWLSRLDVEFNRRWALFDLRSLPECRKGNAHSVAGWLDYLSRIDDAALDVEVGYQNSAGIPYKNLRRDIIAHVLNHSTHHRAQIATLIRQSGGTPPATDYIFYLRNTG
jgi:uncharacterized damage-inducible protein DinB